MSNNKDFKVKNGLDVGGTIALGAIDTSISDTAVDVFVYDTSKDSDGGAWRKRCQHTSWYNETLNTSTRGATKEFPAVAVIVAESNKVTIYDGDDPSMPMWMVFNGGSNTGYSFAGFSPTNRAHSSIVMLNGVMTTGGTQAGYLTTCSFLDEKGVVYLAGGNGVHVLRANIVDRNNTHILATNLGNSNVILNAYVNDVAMTVLPSAPIDPATGLPIPTIAAATNDGVCVIKDDGTVVDYTFQKTNKESDFVAFTENGLSYGLRSGGMYWGGYNDLSAADTAATWDFTYNNLLAGGTCDARFLTTGTLDAESADGNFVSLGAELGLTKIDRNSTDHLGIAYITSDYNTGWMNGDIKLAALSDTDDTDVTGSELVTNGTFDSDTGWTKGNGWSISGGVASITNSGNNVFLEQTITIEAGKTYAFESYVTSYTSGTFAITFDDVTGSFSASHTVVNTRTSAGQLLRYFTGGTSGTVRIIVNATGGATGSVDNVTFRQVEADRSVNGNGLAVHGTITKSPVATGADLVAYSGFSSSNYLKQPYNSDLDFGTGDFTYSFWASAPSSGADRIWLSHGRYSTAGHGLNILHYNSGGSGDEAHFYIGHSGSGHVVVTGVENRGLENWAVVRSSGVLKVYRNGKLAGSVANTTDVNLSNEPIKDLYIGVGNNGSGIYNYGLSELALLRISATAASPEQIAKIYRDEKVLFQENAKATLYGTSDAVTALAYDDDTNLLHVGTSAGRSVFKGLRRVSNTTDAVGTAISASNDLVVEE